MIPMINNPREAASTAPTLPLFYRNPVALRTDLHRDAGLDPSSTFTFARSAIALPLLLSEFVSALRYYPIVFADNDDPTPLAILGVVQGVNLCINEHGAWEPGYYVPAYVRRYPYLLVDSADGKRVHLAVDGACDRFELNGCGDNDRRSFFDPSGNPTPSTRQALKFCEDYQAEHLRTQAFVSAVKQAKLLTSHRADIKLAGGVEHALDGFQVIDEEALRALPAEMISQWHKNSWTDAIALHLASRQNWQSLLDLHLHQVRSKPSADYDTDDGRPWPFGRAAATSTYQ